MPDPLPDERRAELVAMLRDRILIAEETHWPHVAIGIVGAKAILAALQPDESGVVNATMGFDMRPPAPPAPDATAAKARELAAYLATRIEYIGDGCSPEDAKTATDAVSTLRTLAAECETLKDTMDTQRQLLDHICDAPFRLEIARNHIERLKKDRDRLAAEVERQAEALPIQHAELVVLLKTIDTECTRYGYASFATIPHKRIRELLAALAPAPAAGE